MWTNRTLCFSLSGGSCTGVSDSDMLHIVLRLVEGPIGWELTRRIAALHPATASSLLHRRDTRSSKYDQYLLWERPVNGDAIGHAGRRGRRPLPRHHMVTRRIRRTGGSRLSRPRAARVHCATGKGGSRLSRPRAARVHWAPGRRSRGSAGGRAGARPSRTAAPRTRDRASCTGGRTCTDASRRGPGLNDYPDIDTCILIREVLYSSASSRGRGAVTNKEGQADGQRRADREAGGGRWRRGT